MKKLTLLIFGLAAASLAAKKPNILFTQMQEVHTGER
jgi:hypothetical protein